jgi:hypothetical protein
MKRIKTIFFAALALAGAAQADTFNYSFALPGDETITGTLTTGAAVSGGGFKIIAVTGTLSGPLFSGAITGLDTRWGFPDNNLYPTAALPFSSNGLAFDFGASGKLNVYNGGSGHLLTLANVQALDNLSVTASIAAVPELSPALLIAAGAPLMLAFARRRRKPNA